MSIKRYLVAVVGAGVAAVAAAPASAATQSFNLVNNGLSFGVTSITTADSGGPLPVIVQTARAHNLGNPLSSTTQHMLVECVSAQTGAVGLGISDCYLLGLDKGGQYPVPSTGAKPGVADAQAGAVLNVPSQAYAVCVRSRALLANTTFFETPLVCSTS